MATAAIPRTGPTVGPSMMQPNPPRVRAGGATAEFQPAVSASPDPVEIRAAMLILQRHSSLEPGCPLDAEARQAVGLLYTRYREMLIRTARRVLGTSSAAEDVVHDLFERLPRIAGRYHGRGLGGWLRRVALNHALGQCRRERSLERGSGRARVAACAPEDPDLPGDLTIEIRRLPPSLREVLVLRYFLGFTHGEIAVTLCITVAASEVRLCRALARLRESLGAPRPALLAVTGRDESQGRRRAS